MKKQFGVALCAGAASALLFTVSAKGTTAAALIAYFTALPLMIAALSFSHVAGLGGAILGTGAVALGLGPLLGGFYALCFALPAWWLSYLALLAQPMAPASGARPALAWYPVDRLVTWAVGMAVAIVLVLGALVLWHYGGVAHATSVLAKRLAEAVDNTDAAPDAAVVFVRVVPLAMAASLFLMLCVNLWCAGRIARVSDRLRRPWPNVPDGFRLPKILAALLVVALPPTLLDGVVGAAAGALASALGLAFALQGLASAHVLTRGFRARGMVLGLIYIATLAIPVAVLALCLIGIVDCLFALRHRQPPSPPQPKISGV